MSNNSDSDLEDVHWIEGREFLKDYFIWIVFALGFPGNLISIVIIARMSRRRLRTSLFFVGLLAVVDNLSIIMKIVVNQQTRKQMYITETGCQIMYVLGLTLASFANWILVVISIERFTAVMFSMKIMVIWSLRKAMCVVSMLFLVLILIHIHIFFTVTTYDKKRCVPKVWFRDYSYEWFYVSSSVYAIAPALLMVVFNSLTIWKLWRSARERMNLFVRSDLPSVESRHQERQVTIMLVTLAILFVLLTIPRCVYALVIWPMTFSDISRPKKYFLSALTTALSDSNHAVNFYLYFCLVKTFRKQCYALLPCKKEETTSTNDVTEQSELRTMNHDL